MGEWVKTTPTVDGYQCGKSEMNEYSHASYSHSGGGDMWDMNADTDPNHRAQASVWATVWWDVTPDSDYDKLKVDIEIDGSVHSVGDTADSEWTDSVRVYQKVDSGWEMVASSAVHREKDTDMSYKYQQLVSYNFQSGKEYRVQLHCRINSGNSGGSGYARGEVKWEVCDQDDCHLWWHKP